MEKKSTESSASARKLIIRFLLDYVPGALGGIVGGLVGVWMLATYAGNNGCPAAVESLFKSYGYEACGSLGLIVGDVGATLLVIWLLRRRNANDTTLAKIAKWCGGILLALLILIFALFVITGRVIGTSFADMRLFYTFGGLLLAALQWSIPAVVVAILMQIKDFLKSR